MYCMYLNVNPSSCLTAARACVEYDSTRSWTIVKDEESLIIALHTSTSVDQNLA